MAKWCVVSYTPSTALCYGILDTVTEGGETGLGAERGKINPNYWQPLLAAAVTASVLPTPPTLT